MLNIFRKMKRSIALLTGRHFSPRTECICQRERFGSGYGGWDVAVENINEDSVVYSFGIGEDASFDLALIHRFGVIVHAFDPTPKSINWVHGQNFTEKFIFHNYGLADFDGEISFYPPDNPDHVSHTILDKPSTRKNKISVPVKKLSTIMDELGHTKIDILKMDIEGAEYQVINDIANSDIRPFQVLIEFHHRFAGVDLTMTKDTIKKLNGMGYKLFSLSDSGEEFCFIHNS